MPEISTSNDDLMRQYNSKLSNYRNLEVEMDTVKDKAEGLKLVKEAMNLFPKLNRLLCLIRTRGVDVKCGQVTKGFTLESQPRLLAG